jgi:hypothetical protein
LGRWKALSKDEKEPYITQAKAKATEKLRVFLPRSRVERLEKSDGAGSQEPAVWRQAVVRAVIMPGCKKKVDGPQSKGRDKALYNALRRADPTACSYDLCMQDDGSLVHGVPASLLRADTRPRAWKPASWMIERLDAAAMADPTTGKKRAGNAAKRQRGVHLNKMPKAERDLKIRQALSDFHEARRALVATPTDPSIGDSAEDARVAGASPVGRCGAGAQPSSWRARAAQLIANGFVVWPEAFPADVVKDLIDGPGSAEAEREAKAEAAAAARRAQRRVEARERSAALAAASEAAIILGESPPPCPRPGCLLMGGHPGSCAVASEASSRIEGAGSPGCPPRSGNGLGSRVSAPQSGTAGASGTQPEAPPAPARRSLRSRSAAQVWQGARASIAAHVKRAGGPGGPVTVRAPVCTRCEGRYDIPLPKIAWTPAWMALERTGLLPFARLMLRLPPPKKARGIKGAKGIKGVKGISLQCIKTQNIMLSESGSVRQPIHIDSSWAGRKKCNPVPHYYTILVALVDQDEFTGGTRMWPGTHLLEECEIVDEAFVDPKCRAGDAVIFDGLLAHCGTENTTGFARVPGSGEKRDRYFYYLAIGRGKDANTLVTGR